MKKFNRIVSIIAATAVVLSLCACGSGETASEGSSDIKPVAQTPIEIYRLALEKSNDVTSMETDVDTKIQIIADGVDATTKSKANMKIKGDNGNAAMDMTMSVTTPDGSETSSRILFCDSYVYMDLLGQKIKSKVDLETAQSLIGQSSSTELPEPADIADITAAHEDNKTVLTVKYNINATNKFLGGMLGNLGVPEDYITYDEFIGTITVNEKGYPAKASFSAKLSINADGNQAQANLWLDMSFKSINAEFEITAPADADAYIETDSSALTAGAAA